MEQAFDASSPSLTKNPSPPPRWAFRGCRIQIVTWWGDFRLVGACGVRSYPGIQCGEEISVIVRNKFCNGRVFVVC